MKCGDFLQEYSIFGFSFVCSQYRKSKRQKDIKLERVDFTLSEPEATLDGVLDNSPSDWLSLRVGHGVVSHYRVINPSVGRVTVIIMYMYVLYVCMYVCVCVCVCATARY